MKSYNLGQGEFVVLQRSDVSLVSDEGRDPLDEVVLTNKNLILVATVHEGAFRSSRYLKRLPLEQAVDDMGVPRTAVTKVLCRRDCLAVLCWWLCGCCQAMGAGGLERRSG